MTALMMVVLCGFAGDGDRHRPRLDRPAPAPERRGRDRRSRSRQNMPNDYAGWSQTRVLDGVSPSKNALFGYGVTRPTQPTVQFECMSGGTRLHGSGTCTADTSTQDCEHALQAGNLADADREPAATPSSSRRPRRVKTTFAAIPRSAFRRSRSAPPPRRRREEARRNRSTSRSSSTSTNSMNSSCGDSTVPGISGTARRRSTAPRRGSARCSRGSGRALEPAILRNSAPPLGEASSGLNVPGLIDEVGHDGIPTRSPARAPPVRDRLHQRQLLGHLPPPAHRQSARLRHRGPLERLPPVGRRHHAQLDDSNLVESVDWGQCPAQTGSYSRQQQRARP